MRAVEMIRQKREGQAHQPEDLRAFINAFVRDEVPDYQMAAWAMAVYFRGMTPAETAVLTQAMVASGETIDLSGIRGIKVDKHSTGGVGDKTSLVLAPLLAACGLPVAKLSGRGLGHTGGTLDKLESIPGVRVDLTPEQFTRQVNDIGLAVAGQTANLVPADGKLYALRDVTATVESIPLIAASVMSKKIAGGADAIVLDVKVGRGAFMKDLAQAEHLAQEMIAIGEQLGREMGAVLSNMEQPLGRAIGNALEVREAVATLEGRGPDDLLELCLEIGTLSLLLAARRQGQRQTPEAARALLRQAWQSGAALDRFKQMVKAQGGDPADLEAGGRGLPEARWVREVTAVQDGYCHAVDALALGQAAARLGAGRSRKGDVIDPAVGIICHVKMGDPVAVGQPLATLHANDPALLEGEQAQVAQAFTIGATPVGKPPLVLKTLGLA